MARPDVYQEVTDRIIEALERGTVPWHRPWVGSGPVSLRNNRPYRGVNVFLLSLMPYGDPRWGTFKAVKEAGGHVRKGQKATHVILWKPVKKRRSPEQAEGEEALDDTYMLLRMYPVFNAEQCDDLPPYEKGEREHTPIEEAEQIVYGYPGPSISFGGDSASYSQTTDIVRVPHPEAFESGEAYYATLFHELVHSTGHKNRLDRLETTGFGTGPYAKEELVAEMGAAMLCGVAGLEPRYEESASYIDNWLQRLQNDRKFVVSAAAFAQKACDLMLGTKFEVSQEPEREAVAA